MSENINLINIEEQLTKNLTGDLLNNALELCKQMNILGFVYGERTIGGTGWVYRDEIMCWICSISPDHFDIRFFGEGSGFCNGSFDTFAVYKDINPELCKFVWAHSARCGCKNCGTDFPGHKFTILGKDFEKLCNCPLYFLNLNAEDVIKFTALAHVWTQCIDAIKHTAV